MSQTHLQDIKKSEIDSKTNRVIGLLNQPYLEMTPLHNMKSSLDFSQPSSNRNLKVLILRKFEGTPSKIKPWGVWRNTSFKLYHIMYIFQFPNGPLFPTQILVATWQLIKTRWEKIFTVGPETYGKKGQLSRAIMMVLVVYRSLP